MRKVVSIALFGDPARSADGSGMRYHDYIASFALAHHNLFQRSDGWELRIFLDEYDSPASVFALRAQERGLARVERMGPAIRTKAMIWRMVPCFDARVDYVFPRDIDHCPMPRDRAACDVFIESGVDVHTAHDSSSHAGVMGGLCGFHAPEFRRKTGFRSLDDLYAWAQKTDFEWAQHGTDQLVLNRLVNHPAFAAEGLSLLEHRYAGWSGGPHLHKRPAGEYRCEAVTTVMPDVGKSRLAPELQEYADRLAMHLGAAGYDHEAARAFWMERGDRIVARLIAECE